ncbi:peptidase inhibitor 16, partial [Clonorchis sinensis]
MPSLVWSEQLAHEALVLTHECRTPHSRYAHAGENVAISRTHDRDVIKEWFDRNEYYTYGPFQPGKSHRTNSYTQMVWSSTKYVGCHTHLCAKFILGSAKFNNIYYTSCRYSPPGNIPGEKPYTATTETTHRHTGEDGRRTTPTTTHRHTGEDGRRTTPTKPDRRTVENRDTNAGQLTDILHLVENKERKKETVRKREPLPLTSNVHLSTKERMWLEQHNTYRTMLLKGQVKGQPKPIRMMNLTWSNKLAEAAKKAGAEECAGNTSEDGFVVYARDPGYNFVKLWFQQHVTYTYGRFPSENYVENQMYTQIVWAATRQVGCHEYFCESYQMGTEPATNMYISVCNYSPKGNIDNYYPYLTAETVREARRKEIE